MTATETATRTSRNSNTIVAYGAWLAQKCFETEGKLCRTNMSRLEKQREGVRGGASDMDGVMYMLLLRLAAAHSPGPTGPSSLSSPSSTPTHIARIAFN